MTKLKKGDKFIVIKEYSSWVDRKYALKGWTGTIISYNNKFNDYIVKWDKQNVTGDLVKEYMIELIEKYKRDIKKFPICKFWDKIEVKNG